MKKIITLFYIIYLFANNAQAQQLPYSSSYLSETSIENPAFINRNFFKYDMPMTVDFNYRYQWVGLQDAPKTAIGNFQYFNEDLKFLVGGTLINDVTHPTGFTGLMIQGAYQIKFSKDLFATIGLSGGMYQYRVKGADLKFLEQDDIASQNINKFFPDFSIGASLFWKNKYFVGFSIPQTMGLNLNFRNSDNDFNIQRVRHYNATMGAILPLYNDSWLEPTLSVKYLEGVSPLVDVLLKYEREEIFWIGAGGANSGKMHLETGFILYRSGNTADNIFKIGYGYNHFFGAYSSHFGSTHEIKFTFSKTN